MFNSRTDNIRGLSLGKRVPCRCILPGLAQPARNRGKGLQVVHTFCCRIAEHHFLFITPFAKDLYSLCVQRRSSGWLEMLSHSCTHNPEEYSFSEDAMRLGMPESFRPLSSQDSKGNVWCNHSLLRKWLRCCDCTIQQSWLSIMAQLQKKSSTVVMLVTTCYPADMVLLCMQCSRVYCTSTRSLTP